MTKKELVKYLSGWPDEAEVVVSASKSADMQNAHHEDDKLWYEIADVEEHSEDTCDCHCLIIAGRVVMC